MSVCRTPNDPKLSDRALAAPQSEGTIRAVRCSALLADIGIVGYAAGEGKALLKCRPWLSVHGIVPTKLSLADGWRGCVIGWRVE